jgi:hypothetical protein
LDTHTATNEPKFSSKRNACRKTATTHFVDANAGKPADTRSVHAVSSSSPARGRNVYGEVAVVPVVEGKVAAISDTE